MMDLAGFWQEVRSDAIWGPAKERLATLEFVKDPDPAKPDHYMGRLNGSNPGLNAVVGPAAGTGVTNDSTMVTISWQIDQLVLRIGLYQEASNEAPESFVGFAMDSGPTMDDLGNYAPWTMTRSV